MSKVTVLMNTFNEAPVYLKQAIDSYLNQQGILVDLIISAIEDDPNLPYLKTIRQADLHIIKRSEHPGRSPKG